MVNSDAIRLAPIPTPAKRPPITTLGQSMDLMGATMAYPRNSKIFGEGEPAEYLYKVISGSVRTYKILRCRARILPTISV
jgi:hypothetical protein